jgi:putative endonuclease
MWKYIESLFTSREPRATARQQTGLWGEREAEHHLTAKGYKILGRRFRVGAKDEIDLVARIADTLVFIEVKTRAGEDFGRPFSAVDRAKRFHLARAAVRYLKRLKTQPGSFRFDVVEIIGAKNGPEPVVRHIENAFPLPKYFRVP